jgi:hypothetical protein
MNRLLDEDTIGFLTIGAIGLGVVVTAGAVFFGGVYKLIDKAIDVQREKNSTPRVNTLQPQKLPTDTLPTLSVPTVYSNVNESPLTPVYCNSPYPAQGFRWDKNFGYSSLNI